MKQRFVQPEPERVFSAVFLERFVNSKVLLVNNIVSTDRGVANALREVIRYRYDAENSRKNNAR